MRISAGTVLCADHIYALKSNTDMKAHCPPPRAISCLSR